MLKNYIIVVVLAIIMLGAVGYAINETGSPFEVRGQKFDEERVTSLYNISIAIEEYYKKNNALPKTLDELNVDKSLNNYLQKIKDPETQQTYEYLPDTGIKYQLCAIFKTSNVKKRQKGEPEAQQGVSIDYNPAYYNPYIDKFQHPQGRFCFNLSAIREVVSTQLASSSASLNPFSQPVQDRTPVDDITNGDLGFLMAKVAIPTNETNIESVATSAKNIDAKSNFPDGFFNDNNDYGLITSETLPVDLEIKFKGSVRVLGMVLKFGDCPVTRLYCYKWSARGITDKGSSISIGNNENVQGSSSGGVTLAGDVPIKEVRIVAKKANDSKLQMSLKKIKFTYANP